jgi:predicted MPP superfamily phosphohydrolase
VWLDFVLTPDPLHGRVPDPIRAFGSYRERDVALVLVHEPDYFPILVRTTRTDVQLSGHSHGGQVQFSALLPH